MRRTPLAIVTRCIQFHRVRMTPAITSFWIFATLAWEVIDIEGAYLCTDSWIPHMLLQSCWVALGLLKDGLHDRVLQDCHDLSAAC